MLKLVVLAIVCVAVAVDATRIRGRGQRPRCRKPCNRMLAPVCGSNGETYSNKCLFENAKKCEKENRNIEIAYEGKCKCPQMCTMDYRPVCGSDSMTYSNGCALKVAKCEGLSDLEIAYKGECNAEGRSKGLLGKDGAGRQRIIFAKEEETNDEQKTTLIGEGGKGQRKMFGEGGKGQQQMLGQNGAGQRKCPRCHRMYKPVCGSDGKTYPNKCMLETAKCEKGDAELKIDYEGKCKCSKMCNKIYKPVCGSDGKTYANECTFETAKCEMGDAEMKIAYQGKCKCPQMCTMDYRPVCGSDGMTYSNECALKVAKCEDFSNLEIAYKGECNAEGRSKGLLGENGAGRQKIIFATEEKKEDEQETKKKEQTGLFGEGGKGQRKMVGQDGAGQQKTRMKMLGQDGAGRRQVLGGEGKGQQQMLGQNGAGQRKCMRECFSMVYAPVCGSNGKTYTSKCHMEADSCVAELKNLPSVDILYEGKCIVKSECHQQQKNKGLLAGGRRLKGAFRPRCEVTGLFKPMQCHGSTGFCYCVNQATGEQSGQEFRPWLKPEGFTGCERTHGECPENKPTSACKADPCDAATCAKYPQAKCASNYCGGCSAEFYIHGVKVSCEE